MYGEPRDPKSSQDGGSPEQRPHPGSNLGFILYEGSGSGMSDSESGRKHVTAVTTVSWAR